LRWKNALACLPDIETVCSQSVDALEQQITLELSLDLAVLADSAGTRTTGTTRNMECEFATRVRSFCYSGLTGALLRRIEKLVIVENMKKTALSN
jgi:hypothetical protein